MKTIELSAALASAPVQENLKNFAGLDAQNALGLMTPERLAAVAGGKLFKADYISDAQKVDEIYTDGRYIILSKSAHPIFTSGAILISVSVLEYVFQIAISLGNKELFYRTTKKENAWGTWLKITPGNIL